MKYEVRRMGGPPWTEIEAESPKEAAIEWIRKWDGPSCDVTVKDTFGDRHFHVTRRETITWEAEELTRQYVTVLGPDDPTSKPMGYAIHEREGVALHPYDESLGVDTRKTFRRGELQAGMVVGSASLFGGYNIYKIRWDAETETFYGDAGPVRFFLKRTADERACWVCLGQMNTKDFKRITVKKG